MGAAKLRFNEKSGTTKSKSFGKENIRATNVRPSD
jgi:hypothetical protein